MKTPKYIEIASAIGAMIEEGRYSVGNKLPPHRVLAESLDTTPATVAKAYKVLTEQGQIESHIGRGSFVCNNKSLDQVIQSDTDNKEINFSILQPCYDLEHLQLLDKHMHMAYRSADKVKLHGYADNSGLWEHREAGLVWNQSFGVEGQDVEQILLANGAQHAISTLIQLVTQPGDLVAVEAQTYPGILSVLSFLGRRFIGIAMDGQGMIPEALEEACGKEKPVMVIVVPSHQNPTGVTMPAKRREALAEIIARNKLWLLEDDIYGFLNKDTVAPLTNLVPELGFYVSSLSKALSPGLRCAYIQAPAGQSKSLANFIRASIWLAPPLVFAIGTSLIETGDGFRMAARQREIASERHVLARDLLSDKSSFQSTGSYHLWLQLPDYWSSDEFAMVAKEHHLLVSSASFFNANSHPVNAVRLSVMAESREERFIQGLKALSQLIDQKQFKHIHF